MGFAPIFIEDIFKTQRALVSTPVKLHCAAKFPENWFKSGGYS